ncbi:potassium transporter Kup [Microvirga alba]|uniref:Probable potassium transport system protein Kup n=1 Tax=Microvirga alba TaxID=2791025 RepID=A0A931BUW4_9HYPH|nr:potassium transporter Kup [Microvirga alba]MBF9235169.1 potassium transporter Kup [Microvirga alba]
MAKNVSSGDAVERPSEQDHAQLPTRFSTLAVGSIGVVYGDIGTSPLYALREALAAAAAGGALTREMVFGVVSLILWALIVIVTAKYVLLIMRADNHGEGGILSLMALAQSALGHSVLLIPILGVAGAALFYGDAIITPAISVLSAVEGLDLVTPSLKPYILPLSVTILIALFLVQSKGTARVASWFGPIMVGWFIVLGLGGLLRIAQDTTILTAVNPIHGIRFLESHGSAGLIALGAVFLAVTGAEALYADMGHFGRKPIQVAWVALVLPSLALNYLGQGGLLLAEPEKLENPFFLLYPDWALLPMVILGTIATVIASQAVITGAYSLTQQAIQLGLLPRMSVLRTSETEKGQIYIPRINVLLLIAVLMLVVVFKNSSGLASAYGIAVTGTMVITTVLAFFVIWRAWGWSPVVAVILVAPFLLVDSIFLFANGLKIIQGGWIPLAVGGVLMTVMLTWRRGVRLLAERAKREEVPTAEFIKMIEGRSAERVQGTAIFLTSDPSRIPSALLHNLKHNKVLHQQNVLLSVVIEDTPRVDKSRRAEVERLSEHFLRVTLRFGFMEVPNIPRALPACRKQGFQFDVMKTSFFLSRRALKPSLKSEMPRWQDRLFIWLSRRASDASEHFGIPTGRAVEVGTQITI